MPYHNLLLIDDDEDDREIFMTALEKISDSIDCIALDSAHDALQKLSTKQIHTDVIFLDLNMPRMTGHEFLAEIKRSENLRHIPIVIFSTSSDPKTVEETKLLGAHHFITKPDKFDELVHILKLFINQGFKYR